MKELVMGFLNKLFKHPPESAMNLGRNELCWCGSGKKYKKCHYTSDRKYFDAKIMGATCTSSG
ncbi:MAG: SEC-C metal-binding domain-containing protein [candidate division Zixibacteria bacterium]|nr:SEC-C metal-binding domain-containing protein [candidate division Zixibacteria bacterium]